MAENYDAAAIEVLTGLEPVRKRPGMYTDTSRPNHLVQEVVDNSVDEALAGHAREIVVTLREDGGICVSDDGRGMPVDLHPVEGLPGVEVILTRLHAGGKFSNKNYTFSGGLHGVGVSVVNALSSRLEVRVRRDGVEHEMVFAGGETASPLREIGSVGKRNTGTTITFWPDARYFDSIRLAVPRLKHLLRAKAVLCPGLSVTLNDAASGESIRWCYEDGFTDYLGTEMADAELLPKSAIVGRRRGKEEAVEWALQWRLDEGEPLTESYVNLVPTREGGTQVSGLKQGILEAFREFCDYRNLLPRGVKLTAEDVMDGCAYLLSLKMAEPQFAGQTKERLSSRSATPFVSGAVRDELALWLNQHPETADRLAQRAIERAQRRQKAAKKVVRKRIAGGPPLPGKLADCTLQDLDRTELFLVEGDSAGGSAKQARDRTFQAVMPLRGKILNTWEVDSAEVLASQEVHDIAVAIGVDPGSIDISRLRYGKICILADADSDGLHIATLLAALFVRHFRTLVEEGHVYVAMPPLYRIDVGKQWFYALDDDEKAGVLERIASENPRAKPSVQRFKGLGEMNPLQLRETTMSPDTRRLVQLTIGETGQAETLLDMLLAKKRAGDRKAWLEQKGNLATVEV